MYLHNADSESDFVLDEDDSDDSDSDAPFYELLLNRVSADAEEAATASGSTERAVPEARRNQTRRAYGSTADDDGDSDDEDDVVKAIIAATKVPRSHPPDIATDDFVVDLSFHPEEDILAVGTLTGKNVYPLALCRLTSRLCR